jgi:hypothetical protein
MRVSIRDSKGCAKALIDRHHLDAAVPQIINDGAERGGLEGSAEQARLGHVLAEALLDLDR